MIYKVYFIDYQLFNIVFNGLMKYGIPKNCTMELAPLEAVFIVMRPSK